MGTSSSIEFKSADRSMSAEEASTEVLKTLLAQAKLAAGHFDLEGTVITIPAAFNQMQCEATMRAAQAAWHRQGRPGPGTHRRRHGVDRGSSTAQFGS